MSDERKEFYWPIGTRVIVSDFFLTSFGRYEWSRAYKDLPLKVTLVHGVPGVKHPDPVNGWIQAEKLYFKPYLPDIYGE